MPDAEIYIGLMSGTSMDGIDAALVRFSSNKPQLLASHSHPWPDDMQQTLIRARELPDSELHSLDKLDLKLAEIFADACLTLLRQTPYSPEDITAIGSHGQTIRHRPDIENPFSLQLGNAEKLAGLTGIDVVSDFRTADIKAGGQGAPLAPAFHQAVFRDCNHNRVIVNIGGIANLTVLSKDKNIPVSGFDCGPGNTLMDAWIRQEKQQDYDRDGVFATSGKTCAGLLAAMLTDDFFRQAPPKSTGFEYFNLAWLQHYLTQEKTVLSPADVQSTLCDLTATSIIRAINQYGEDCDEIFICGGGVHNKTLMQRLQALTTKPVRSTQEAGIHPDCVEAMAFAWLAYRHLQGQTGNLPAVTGAGKAVVLGKYTPAHPGRQNQAEY